LIIAKLHFDEQQIKAYETMVAGHRAEIKKSDEQIFKLKNALYSHLNEEINQQTKDSLIAAIAGVQTTIEQTHYKHFEDIKKLCKADQQKDFEKLTQEIASLFGRPRQRERK
jgi:protein CpxP